VRADDSEEASTTGSSCSQSAEAVDLEKLVPHSVSVISLIFRVDLHNLLSMKGIGVVSAMDLLYLFRKYPGANRNEITALAGLDPVRRQSGSSLNGGRKISRAGDPLLRKVLSLACMNSIQHNECIQAFYKHLVSDHHKNPTLHCLLA